ncbi:hypothetical protein HK405_014528, partial [Cladochytrium tenue]
MEREQRELYQADQALAAARGEASQQAAQLAAARDELARLEARVARLRELRRELAAVLDAAFVPPVARVDGHDVVFYEAQTLALQINELEASKRQHDAALVQLDHARAALEEALGSVESAANSAQVDIFFRNSFSEINEYMSSQRAQELARVAGLHLRNAAAVLPSLPGYLGSLDVPAVDIFGTVIFDNVFSEIFNLRMLQQAAQQLALVLRNVIAVIQHVRAAQASIGDSLARAAARLVEAREHLASIRVRAAAVAVAAAGAADALADADAPALFGPFWSTFGK